MKDHSDYTTLHRAMMMMGSRELIELLLDKGVDVNAKSNDGQIVLRSRGGRRRKSTGAQTALHLAVGHGSKDIVELLLEKGADINAKDSEGQTALQLAEKRKRTEIVELLRRHGAKE